jgi:hypothetical protein
MTYQMALQAALDKNLPYRDALILAANRAEEFQIPMAVVVDMEKDYFYYTVECDAVAEYMDLKIVQKVYP